MIEDKVKIWSENLARNLDRRKFLRGTGTALFGGLAAFAAGHFTLARAQAAAGPGGTDTAPPPWPPQCAPPGPYCNITGVSDGSGCNAARGPYDPGGSCFQHLWQGQLLRCYIIYNWYQAGCWTSAGSGGYWTCCDCGCADSGGTQRAMCGCAQFSAGPPPRPDTKLGRAGAAS